MELNRYLRVWSRGSYRNIPKEIQPVPIKEPRFAVGETIYYIADREIKSMVIERIEVVWQEKFSTCKYGRYRGGEGFTMIDDDDAFSTPDELANKLLREAKAK